VRGLTALANRDYPGAAAAFSEAGRRGLSDGALRPMLAYALARSERTAEAARLAPARPGEDEQTQFWLWLRNKFGIGP